jgi:hypothetical protein
MSTHWKRQQKGKFLFQTKSFKVRSMCTKWKRASCKNFAFSYLFSINRLYGSFPYFLTKLAQTIPLHLLCSATYAAITYGESQRPNMQRGWHLKKRSCAEVAVSLRRTQPTLQIACSVIVVGQSCMDTLRTAVYMEVPLLGSCYIFVITWSWPALSIICLGGVTAGGAFRCPSTVVPAPSAIVRKYIPWRGAVCGFLVHPLLNYTQWS